MALLVVNAFGTAEEILFELRPIQSAILLQTYKDVAATSLQSLGSGAVTSFADSVDAAPVDPPSDGGSLVCISPAGAQGNGMRMGALNAVDGGVPLDLTESPSISIWVKFNQIALDTMSAGGTANTIRLFSDITGGGAYFLWNFNLTEVANDPDTWVELIRTFPATSETNTPDIAAISHVEVSWAANPVPTAGGESMSLDTFEAAVIPVAVSAIDSIQIRPEGGDKARTWVVYDDGT